MLLQQAMCKRTLEHAGTKVLQLPPRRMLSAQPRELHNELCRPQSIPGWAFGWLHWWPGCLVERREETSTHLLKGALASQKLVGDSAGDAEHGCEGQSPANCLSPPGVDVGLVVRQRLVVHHMEQENSLGREGAREGLLGRGGKPKSRFRALVHKTLLFRFI